MSLNSFYCKTKYKIIGENLFISNHVIDKSYIILFFQKITHINQTKRRFLITITQPTQFFFEMNLLSNYYKYFILKNSRCGFSKKKWIKLNKRKEDLSGRLTLLIKNKIK
jgi:hypothetical protein